MEQDSFVRVHDGVVYSRDRAGVIQIAREIFEIADGFVGQDESVCSSVSVCGLEYFMQMPRKGGLVLVGDRAAGDQEEKTVLVYNTIHPHTHKLKEVLLK